MQGGAMNIVNVIHWVFSDDQPMSPAHLPNQPLSVIVAIVQYLQLRGVGPVAGWYDNQHY